MILKKNMACFGHRLFSMGQYPQSLLCSKCFVQNAYKMPLVFKYLHLPPTFLNGNFSDQLASYIDEWSHDVAPKHLTSDKTFFHWDLVMKKNSTIILSLPLIQEGQLSVTGERMGTKYW